MFAHLAYFGILTIGGGWQATVLQQITEPFFGPILIPMWFIRDLMIVVVLTPLVAWLIRHTRWVILLILGIIYLLKIQILVPDLLITALFFFSIGSYGALNKRQLSSDVKPCTLPLIVIWMLLMAYGIRYDGSETSEGLILYPLMVLVGVISVIGLTATIVYKRRGNRESKDSTLFSRFSDYAAQNTFFIFAAHGLFGLQIAGMVIRPLFDLLPDTPLVIAVHYLLMPFVAIAICLVALWLLQRWLPGVAKILTGGR